MTGANSGKRATWFIRGDASKSTRRIGPKVKSRSRLNNF
jgi:hypothetical protein